MTQAVRIISPTLLYPSRLRETNSKTRHACLNLSSCPFFFDTGFFPPKAQPPPLAGFFLVLIFLTTFLFLTTFPFFIVFFFGRDIFFFAGFFFINFFLFFDILLRGLIADFTRTVAEFVCHCRRTVGYCRRYILCISANSCVNLLNAVAISPILTVSFDDSADLISYPISARRERIVFCFNLLKIVEN